MKQDRYWTERKGLWVPFAQTIPVSASTGSGRYGAYTIPSGKRGYLHNFSLDYSVILPGSSADYTSMTLLFQPSGSAMSWLFGHHQTEPTRSMNYTSAFFPDTAVKEGDYIAWELGEALSNGEVLYTLSYNILLFD